MLIPNPQPYGSMSSLPLENEAHIAFRHPGSVAYALAQPIAAVLLQPLGAPFSSRMPQSIGPLHPGGCFHICQPRFPHRGAYLTSILYYGIPAEPISRAFCSSIHSPSGLSGTHRLPESGASACVRPIVLSPSIVSALWDCTFSHLQRCSTRWDRLFFSRMPQSMWSRSIR